MKPEHWQQIDEILEAALEREESQRAAFLEEACGGDEALRREVEHLLVQEVKAEDFLETPALEVEAKAMAEAQTYPLVGRQIGSYNILSPLGSGGMGEVFLAHDTTLNRKVALKFLPNFMQEDPTARKRFLREAKMAAALDHPFICKVYEIGEEDGKAFISMEYLRGKTLKERLAEGRLALKEALGIAGEIAEALAEAHEGGIVHRDLKPANIMLTPQGHAKVMDFGLAKQLIPAEGVGSQEESLTGMTKTGTTLGTLPYMSPEQMRGEEVDTRSDVFSFGVLLYEMIAGAHPFWKAQRMETVSAILRDEPSPLRDYVPNLPEGLEQTVEKMLAKRPEERFQIVQEVYRNLNRMQGGPGGLKLRSRPIGLWRSRPLQLLLAVIVLVAGLLIWWGVFSGPSSPGGVLPSVAVLPLTNISEDPLESDYLAHGISQAVTSRLTQIGLRVTPWESARRYGEGNQTPQATARELNVDAVLTGTFQITGDQILTNVALVEAGTGLQSWADTSVLPYEDLFQVQLQIAAGVAEKLKKKLTGQEEEILAIAESGSVDAYDSYLQGAYFMQEATQEATGVAFDYFSRAVELDPDLVEAHVGLGTAYYSQFHEGWEGGLQNLDLAESSFETALRLNPTSIRARRGLMHVYWERGSTEACLIQGQEAARLGQPSDVETLLAQGWAYLFGGLADRGLPFLRRVIELDPVNESAHWGLAVWARGTEESIEVGETYFNRFGDDQQLHIWVGLSYQALGDLARAQEHYQKARGLTSATSPSIRSSASHANLQGLLFSGLIYERLGDHIRARQTWQRGVELLKPDREAPIPTT